MRPYLARLRRTDRRSRSRGSRPFLEPIEGRTLLSSVAWTGGAGTDDWDTPANWSTDSLPGPADDVTIGATATVVHSDDDSDTINSLTSSGTLSITGGTLSIASASTVDTLTVGGSRGTLSVNGSLTVNGLLTLGFGELSGTGSVTANAGIAMDLDNANLVLDGITLNNPVGQTASITGSANNAEITAEDGAVFNNDGTFNADNGVVVYDGNSGTPGAPSAFNNDGSFIKSGQGTLAFSTSDAFNSDGGTVDVQGGTLDLSSGGTVIDSTFTAESGAELELGGTSSLDYTFDSASTIQGAGTVNFVGDTVTLNGTYDVTGSTEDNGAGVVNFDGPIDSLGTSLTATSGTLNFNTSFIGTAGTFTGLVTLSETATLSGADTVDAAGGITINGNLTLDGLTLDNAAGQTAAWSGGDVTLEDGAVFNNFGTFNVTADTYWGQGTGAPSSFNNAGALVCSSDYDNSYPFFNLPFNSLGGTVDVKSGYFGFEGKVTSTGGSFTAESGAELALGGGEGVTSTLDASSTIGGAGTVDFTTEGTLTMNGTYDVTGTTMCGGPYGTVNFDGPVDSIGSTVNVEESTVNFNTAFVGSAGTIGNVEATYGGTLNLGANDLTATTMTLAGTLSGTGTVTVNGLLTFQDDATISGCTVNPDGGTAVASNPYGYTGITLSGCTFNNPSGQTFTNGLSGVLLQDGAIFNNFGTVDATNYVEFSGNPGTSQTVATFNNTGTFIADYASSPIEFGGTAFNDDGGSVDVKQGTLELAGGGVSTGGSFTIESGATLEMDGGPEDPYTFDAATTLSSAGSFTLGGSGLVIFAGTSTLTGPTSDGGELQFDGSQPSSTVSDTYSLSGTGTVGPITSDAGQISPGDGATEPGILTADGNVSLSGNATLNIALNGTTAGTGYDQLNATGSVSLGEYTTLNVTLGFTPAVGETFTIIKSTAPITGTFVNLHGTSVTIDGVPFTISYTADGGDEVVLTSAGATTTSTTTTLSSSANPSTIGQSVTFTAAVAAASGTATPTGTVTFTIDGQAQTPVDLSVVGGVDQATFSTTTLTIGLHTISAAYSGDSSFSSSTVSTPLSQTVDAPTTTTLSSSANPSTLGESVTFTATVAGPSGAGTPSGSVSFEEGSTTLESVALDATGQATFTTSTLAQGSDAITAVFAATGNFLASSSAPLTQVVNPVPLQATATQIASSANPSTVGQSVTFTAIVAATGGAGTPIGTVTFTIDGQAQAPSALSVVAGVDEAVFTTASLAVGAHTIGAAYSGDSTFAPSKATPSLTQTINAPALLATSTQVTSSANPTVGQSVTFTAVVMPTAGTTAIPTGTVIFTIDNQAQTPVLLSVVNGVDQASFSIATLSAGPHTISAAYSGDATFAGSSPTSPLTGTVEAAVLEPSATTVLSSADPSTAGQSVVFTATVASTTGSGTPTGTVTFTIDGKAGSPVNLTEASGKDQATFTMPDLAAGSYTITAAYSGDTAFAPSHSSTATQVVAPPVTTQTSVTAPAGDGPKIISVRRYGYHMRPTTVDLVFDQALDAATAQDVDDYRIIGPAGRAIAIKRATYDPSTLTVILHPSQRISIHHTYKLIVDGTSPHGITNTLGQLLDGTDAGRPDADYRTTLTWRNLVLDPVPSGISRWPRRTTGIV
jgi:hypothetical protein